MLSRRELCVLLALLGAGLALRLYFYTGLHGSDDLTHAYAAAHFWGDPADSNATVSGAFSVNVRRLGVNFPLWLSTSVFGVHEWSLSLVPLLFSLIGIVAAFATAKLLAGSIAGLGAAAIWTFLPVDIYHAGNWLQDNIFATVFLIACALLVASEREGAHRRRWALGAGIALGVLVYVKESAFVLALPIGAWLLLASFRARRLDVRIAWGLGGFVAVQALAAIYFAIVFGDPLAFFTATFGRYGEIASTEIHDRHDLVSTLGMAGRYAYDQWIFGFGAVAFPVLATAALANRRLLARPLWAMLLVVQLAVLIQAIKFGNWTKPLLSAQGTERYNLQLTPIYVVLTAVGAVALARAVIARWPTLGTARLRHALPAALLIALVAATGAALDPAHERYDRYGAAVVRDAFGFLEIMATPHEHIYVDGAPFVDTAGRPMPSYTQRIFELLSGYRPWKGGFQPVDEATAATAGWVVLTSFEHRRVKTRGVNPLDAPPPTWIEVFRSERRRGRVYARVFKIVPKAPSPPIQVLGPVGGSAAPAETPPPDIDVATLVPIAATSVAVSARWTAAADVSLASPAPASDGTVGSATGAPLTVTVTPDASPADKRLGGVVVPVEGLGAARFRLSIPDARHAKTVFVYATAPGRDEVHRWSWTPTNEDRSGAIEVPVALVPGRASGRFRYTAAALAPAAIRELHIFVRVDGGPVTFRVADLGVK